jgi:hypothetical protein
MAGLEGYLPGLFLFLPANGFGFSGLPDGYWKTGLYALDLAAY